MVGVTVHSKEEGPSETVEFNSFDQAADAVRVHVVPEVANAIDDAVSDGGRDMKRRVKQLTDILARISSVSMEEVERGVKDWERLVVDDGLGYGWVELHQD